MNIQQFYTLVAGLMSLLSLAFLVPSLRAAIPVEYRQSLEFRVRECLKTDFPGQCVRKRGLLIPGQSKVHRFVIYGGELNVNRRRDTNFANDDYRDLQDDFTQILISSGARLNTPDGIGLTPLDYAVKGTNMYTILRRAGAKHSSEL